MICAVDVGNTQTKFFLIDDDYDIIAQKSWSTPDLFEPGGWAYIFSILDTLNPLFMSADLRISCVNWKAFLALRVYLKYDKDFNPQRGFEMELLNNLPKNTPVVLEKNIPLKRDNIQGLIGSDRMLSAYAVHKIFNKSAIVVSLGTATTIDLVTESGEFVSGVIAPGVDSAYQGLIEKATSLPAISALTPPENNLSTNGLESLYLGSFVAQAILIEQFMLRITKDYKISSSVDLILTGGRASSISPHLDKKHTVVDGLVGYGLALLSTQNEKNYQKKITHLASKFK